MIFRFHSACPYARSIATTRNCDHGYMWRIENHTYVCVRIPGGGRCRGSCNYLCFMKGVCLAMMSWMTSCENLERR